MGRLTRRAELTRKAESDKVKGIFLYENTIDDTNCFLEGEYGYKAFNKLASYEDIIDEPEKLKLIDVWYSELCKENGQLMKELAEYKKLEEEGFLLRLPISEDTPVYSIEYCCGKNKENKMGMCFRGFCEGCSDKSYYIKEGKAKQCSISEINRSVFLTKEEAEQALERMKGDS